MTHARPPETPALTLTRICHSPEELEALGAELSLFARPGMVILLKGDLGTGKSTLARAFIRAMRAGPADFDIPSPTFTLVQSYDETRLPVLHADLYRLTSDAEISELGLDDMLAMHVMLVEWPERLLARSWPDVLLVELSGHGGQRQVQMTARGAWVQALQRNQVISGFVAATPWKSATRTFLEGDASFRRYETLTGAGQPMILMDMPARPDGPPVRHGKPYSAIAHLAEDIRAVVAANSQLRQMGYNAPHVEAFDLDAGLAIIEDLGRAVYGKMILAGEDMREPMEAAVAVLADMATRDWPRTVRITAGETYSLSAYDIEAQQIEADLLPSWFWPYAYGRDIGADEHAAFENLWAELLPLTQPAKPVWTLRDYHSPNLLWLPEREGLQRVGLIDTQDCVLGHPAYDLASMLQDARVDIAFDWADALFEIYCQQRSASGPFDRAEFETAYAILGAQRATKILGIFARLSKRDGKHGYLRHMPRVSRYLERNLQHPALKGLRQWYDTHLPAVTRERVS